VKVAAQALGIPVFQPSSLRRDASPALFAEVFDLFVVASYGQIVPQRLLDIPRLGALNVHPSLLPLYRGAAPLQAQIRDGVTDAGVTIMLMDAGMDTGDVVLQEHSPIGECETYGELHDRFALLGAALLRRALEQTERGALTRTAQAALMPPERILAATTRPLSKDDLWITWAECTPLDIVRRVRAYAPSPSARALLGGESVKILAASLPVGDGGVPSGAVRVACKGGDVVIERVVPPNRRAMDAAAYLATSVRS
jgi:methionyl-tRNA formyltransferase